MNDFERDDAWQRELRDRLLAPHFYSLFAFDGRYVFIDKGRLATTFQKRFAVDTIVQGRKGAGLCIEEKIVRWPKVKQPDGSWRPRDRPYTAFCLETKSCTKAGWESDGWMVYGESDYLLYCFANKDESALDCYLIDFPALQAWFWPRADSFSDFQMRDTINESAGKVVPIADVQGAVPTWRRTAGGVLVPA